MDCACAYFADRLSFAWGDGGMDCGAGEYACQVLEWVSANEFAAGVISKAVAHLGTHAANVVGWIAVMWQTHGEKIIAAAGVAFGVWRWWRYREQILHKRLEEYLHDSDSRLLEGQNYLLEAIQRPGPGQVFKLPLFANAQLLSVLRERRWDNSPTAATVASSADMQLRKAGEKIKDQMETAQGTIESLREQLATSLLLRGAIAASSPLSRWHDKRERDSFALTAFRSVLQIPGHERNVLAKELEAHQLRKLGQFEASLSAYQEVEELAASIEDTRKQQLCIARVKRFRAETTIAQASCVQTDGKICWGGLWNAWQLVNGAIQMRSPFLPFYDWDLLEQGDIYYLAALLAHHQGFVRLEPKHLDEAETAYEGVLDGLKRRQWPVTWKRGYRKLRMNAEAGLDRVAKAKEISGTYDVAWLLPNLDDPQK